MDGLDGCGKSRLHRDSIPGPSSPYRVVKLRIFFRMYIVRFLYQLYYKLTSLGVQVTARHVSICLSVCLCVLILRRVKQDVGLMKALCCCTARE